MSGNKNSPSGVQDDAKITSRRDGTESGIHKSSTLATSGMVDRGDGDSSLDTTPNPMNTCIPSSKRIMEEVADDHCPVKRLKLVNAGTTTRDPPCCPEDQVAIANSRPNDVGQPQPSSASQESKPKEGFLLPFSEVIAARMAAPREEGSSTASPTLDILSTSVAPPPSVVSPPQKQNSNSIVIGVSSSQSRLTTVLLEAKAEQCDESASATPVDAHSGEGATETQRPSSPPLKSTKMSHLKKKYTGELEYMLREFRKLERQLLGAKGNVLEESAGSRERREKLHSFIIHLEGTIREIEVGCQLEAEGKSTVQGAETRDSEETEEQAKKKIADTAALTKLTREKEEEENVQKLEEHILANLLPVKVRLKKQLAAQQGASQNPAGMPARRGSLVASTPATTGTTFAAAAEQRRKAEAARLAATAASTPVSATTITANSATSTASSKADSQFSSSISGGGSSLTQKLLGSTSGPSSTESRGASSATGESHVSVADKPASPNPINGQNPSIAVSTTGTVGSSATQPPVDAATIQMTPTVVSSSASTVLKAASAALKTPVTVVSSSPPATQSSNVGADVPSSAASILHSDLLDDDCDDLSFTEEERKRMRKRKRKKKQRREQRSDPGQDQRDLLLHQQAVQAAAAAPKGAAKRNNKTQGVVASTLSNNKGPASGKKKGPRTVEYICALCSESYNSTCEYNPWWALVQHECPKCRKTQIPRVDISSPANAIEYHPALLASADDTGGGGGGSGGGPVASVPAVQANPTHIKPNQVMSTTVALVAPPSPPQFNPAFYSDDSDSGSELSDELLLTDASDDGSFIDSDDSDLENFLQSFSPGEQAENESFGLEYTGPKFSDRDAARLLLLMDHASTCPGRHKSTQHREVCRSVKFLMLHVRDCPGTTSTFDVCPFPWCRKSKHLLYHLVSCTTPTICSICTPTVLSNSFVALQGLNEHRRKRQRERMMAAAGAARNKLSASQQNHLLAGAKLLPAAARSAKSNVPQSANNKPSHSSRQPPPTYPPKVISTSIKPISGQRMGSTTASGRSSTSSILQRPKASFTKVDGKPVSMALVPPAPKVSLKPSVPGAPGVAEASSDQPSVSPPPVGPSVPGEALKTANLAARPMYSKLESESILLPGNEDARVPDKCASTSGNPASTEIAAPGKPIEIVINVAETSSDVDVTHAVSLSPANALFDATKPCKNGTFAETPPATMVLPPAFPVALQTSDTEGRRGELLTPNTTNTPVVPVETPIETEPSSIPMSQNNLSIIKTELVLTEQEDGSQRSPSSSAIEDVKTQGGETVKVGC